MSQTAVLAARTHSPEARTPCSEMDYRPEPHPSKATVNSPDPRSLASYRLCDLAQVA